MPTNDSLLRLELLVVICQQLPEDEADELMWLAIDDPLTFTAAVLSAHSAQKFTLSKAQLRLLRRDLAVRSVRKAARRGLTPA